MNNKQFSIDNAKVVEKLQNVEQNTKEYVRIDDYAMEFMNVRPLPSQKTEISSKIIKNLVNKSTLLFKTIGPPISSSGDSSEETFGTIAYKNETGELIKIYFLIIDDPGCSGYDCCGGIILDYCSNLEHLVAFGMTDKQKSEILEKL